jgi:hypothetical protein
MERENVVQRIDVEDRKGGMDTENISELLKVLIETNREQGAQSVVFMLQFMDTMESELKSVNEELAKVRQELKSIPMKTETAPLRNRLAKLIKGLEEQVQFLQVKLKEMKTTLNQKAGEVVTDFKQHGVKALANVTKVLGICTMLTSIHSSMEKGFAKVEKKIENINRIEKKYREVTQHLKNAGRVLQGKEPGEIKYPEKGLFESMRKSHRAMKNIYARGMAETKHAVVKMTALEKQGQKKSITEKLKDFKEQQGEKENTPIKKERGQEYGR